MVEIQKADTEVNEKTINKVLINILRGKDINDEERALLEKTDKYKKSVEEIIKDIIAKSRKYD
ncbi:hypothetical protein IJM86_00820 [bacterium]|nr:hypothetical protein [bacterium]